MHTGVEMQCFILDIFKFPLFKLIYFLQYLDLSLNFNAYLYRYIGPTLKGEIGEQLRIHFRNVITQVNANLSIHPHGLFYTKHHEGL